MIALLALTVSYTEAAAAAVCDSAMAMKQSTPAQAASGAAGMPMPDHAPSKSSDTNCPYSVPGSPTTCIFSIALPGTLLINAPAVLEHTASVVETASPYHILLTHSLFHPPKA
jgi:hypothetical protein